MDNAQYKTKLGQIIKQAREHRGITQQELSGVDNDAKFICTVRHLKRIERGDVDLNHFMLLKILEALRIDIEDFSVMLHGNDMKLFYNHFGKAWEHVFNEEYETFKTKIDELKAKEYCDTSIAAVKQAMLLCDAVIYKYLDGNHAASLELLCDALRLTAPGLINEKNVVKSSKIKDLKLNIMEYRILKQIALDKDDLGKKREAINIETATITSLEQEDVDYSVQKKLLPTLYYNLSYNLIDEKEYDKADEIIDHGLTFCLSTGELKMIGSLSYSKGRVLALTEHKEQAKIWFRQSYDTFVSEGKFKRAELVKNMAAQKHGINLG
ncbi:MAG: helix-turn-helix transcriptional regulator [Firmicutes bacterium]|nr:helix-turn-helix transcriptional regulator [Bacillota bacterium]